MDIGGKLKYKATLGYEFYLQALIVFLKVSKYSNDKRSNFLKKLWGY